MIPEGNGVLHRRWAYLISDGTECAPSRFWWRFLRETAMPLFESLHEHFRPWCEQKCGPGEVHIGQLVCFEAEDRFEFHAAHTHPYSDWLFTMLIYIDDGGREDRGTRLYRDPDTPLLDTGFKPGRMLAFFEAENAWHGSTPFEGCQAGRKILRAHVLHRVT